MDSPMIVDLASNAALLLALVLFYDLIGLDWEVGKTSFKQFLSGFGIGILGILLMLTPWQLSPGIFFDTRSILISTAALFFGPIPAAIGVLMTSIMRFYQGGNGTIAGITVIITSAATGLIWRHVWRGNFENISARASYLFGFLVHVIMLLCMLLLPPTMIWNVLSKISLPVLIVYPIGTLLLVQVMTNHIKRRRIARNLEISEEKYRTLFETMVQGVVYQDSQGRIISANLAAQSILGLTFDQMQGKTSVDPQWRAIHEDESDYPGDTHPAIVALQTGKEVHDQIMGVYNPVTGHHTWINVNAVPQFKEGQTTPYQVYTTFEDITRRREAEEALHHSETLYRLLAENMKDVIWILDAQDMNFRYVSPSVETLRGYTVEEVMSQSATEALTPPSQAYLAEVMPPRIERFMGGNHETYTDLIEQPRKDGSTVWTEVVTHYYINTESGRLEIHGVSRDITERKRAEEELRLSQKFSDLGTLTAGMAHEMNSPLQVITGSADSLLETIKKNEYMDPARLKRYLENISRNSWRIAELVRALNLYARPTVPFVEPFAFNELIHDTLLLIEHQLKTWSNIQINLDLEDDLPLIFCNRNEIIQILINLLTNARDAMPEGGTILISSMHDIQEDEVILTVMDNGSGIPLEIQEKIFDPFFTTKAFGKGTGLGLSIVQGIMRSYEGRIDLTSESGKGTTLRLIFPVNKAQTIKADEEEKLGRYL